MKYIQNGEEKNISFETADFSTMIEKSNPLYTYGVIFCKKTQEISVSYKAPKWYQLLAAIHEYLCQIEDACGDEYHCKESEERVLETINEIDWKQLGVNLSKEEIKQSYIEARVKMFEACIGVQADDKLKIKMSHALEFLRQL